MTSRADYITEYKAVLNYSGSRTSRVSSALFSVQIKGNVRHANNYVSLRELVTLPASQHCATIRINLNLQLRVANQTILSTFRARSVSRPIVPSLRTCKSRKKDKTSDSFRNQNNLCICIYICIKYSEIIKIKYCHRDERYETTVLFLLFDRTVSLRH